MFTLKFISNLFAVIALVALTGCSEQLNSVNNGDAQVSSPSQQTKNSTEEDATTPDFDKLVLQVVFWRRSIEDSHQDLLLAFSEQEKQRLKQHIANLQARGPGVGVEDLNKAIEIYKNRNGDLSDLTMDAMMLIAAEALLSDGELEATTSPYIDEIQQLLLTEQGIARIEERLGKFYSEVRLYQTAATSSQDYGFIDQLFERSKTPAIKDSIAVGGTWSTNRFVNADEQTRAVMKARFHKLSDYYLGRYDRAEALESLSESERLSVWRMRGSRYHVDHLDIGKTLPKLAFDRVDGGKDTTDNYRGKYLLLDFWTTTCGPCKKAMPKKDKLVKEFAEQGKAFQLASIACDEDLEDVHLYHEEEFAMDWENWHFPTDTEHGESLAIRAYPTYFLLSPEGEILKKGNDFNAMERAIRELLP